MAGGRCSSWRFWCSLAGSMLCGAAQSMPQIIALPGPAGTGCGRIAGAGAGSDRRRGFAAGATALSGAVHRHVRAFQRCRALAGRVHHLGAFLALGVLRQPAGRPAGAGHDRDRAAQTGRPAQKRSIDYRRGIAADRRDRVVVVVAGMGRHGVSMGVAGKRWTAGGNRVLCRPVRRGRKCAPRSR